VIIHAVGFYFLPALSVLVSLLLLILQLRMWGRTGHRSFLLLAAGSLCGLIYLLGLFGLSFYIGHRDPSDPVPDLLPSTWTYMATALQTGTLVLGLWGMVSLFRSYLLLSPSARP
jgi:hypothetical protein